MDNSNNGIEKKAGEVTKPFKFKSPESLQTACDAYFADSSNRPWCMSELALVLGCSRSTLINYEGRNGYGQVLRHAVQLIEAQTEKMLINGGNVRAAGPIFVLSNNFKDWHQKQESTINANVNANVQSKVQIEFVRSDASH